MEWRSGADRAVQTMAGAGRSFDAPDSALPEDDVRKLFESQTSMRYNDIPLNPSESERNRITSQLTGYISAVCPKELENYRKR